MSQVGLSCRLPVALETASASPVSFQGGFLTFPAASFAPDPAGHITSTAAGASPSYDAVRHRWLPVGAAQSSPDGGSFAYSVLGEKKVHVVSLATGADRSYPVDLSAPGSLGIVVETFDGAHALLAAGYAEGRPATGLWRLDISSGAVSRVATQSNLAGVSGGAAWVEYLDPHDPSPPQSSAGYPLFDSLVRIDIATGARTTWTYRPGKSLMVSALGANGDVALSVYDPTDPSALEIRYLSGPTQGGEDNGVLVYSGGLFFGRLLIDGDRIWLGSDRGIYLFTADAGLQKVYAITPTAGVSVSPAGFCR